MDDRAGMLLMPSKHEALNSTPSTAKNRQTEKRRMAGHQWLTPVILASQEAEIRKIPVQSQPGQIVHKTLS
jgi:hypothetical protein